MKIKPLQNRVLVREIEVEKVTGRGIHIPCSAQKKPTKGVVVEVGKGSCDVAGNIIPLEVKEGDEVFFNSWSGSDVFIDGDNYYLMKEHDILAII